VNILTSRDNPMARVIDTLTVDFIKSIPDDLQFKGGIKDFGTFSEGSCLEIKTVRPMNYFKMSIEQSEPDKGLSEVWLICLNDEKEKNQFMNILIKLKLKKQHSLGIYLNTGSSGVDKQTEAEKKSLEEMIAPPPADADATLDGKWIVLQDWAQCTLKCGGGMSYQQLMCIPPKKGGKPCQGPAIRTRPCNTQPCPTVNIDTKSSLIPSLNSNKNSDKPNQTKNPIFKMMPMSTRPQKYDKCYLKETDAIFTLLSDINTNDNISDSLPQIPVRLVMNNKTINVYKDETFKQNLGSFVLSHTTFSRAKDNGCFILTSNNNRARFCQLTGYNGNYVEEWDYDFNLFKLQCKEKRATYDLDPEHEKQIKKDLDDKMNQIKVDLVQEKVKSVRQKTQANDEIVFKKKIENAQSMTYAALQRENRLEELISKEMEEKENQEQIELKVQLENEKKRNDFLMKSIKEKELEDQNNLNKAHAEEAIKNIKEQAHKAIMLKRIKMKQHLESLKRRSSRQKKQIQNDILTVRMEVAGKMQQVTKVGDMKKCFKAKEKDSKVEEYCNTNFTADYVKLQDCLNFDIFCNVCCENEYGELHILERDECYKKQCQ
jgi:hypothetical protein